MRAFAEELLETALELGCDAAETCVDESNSFRVKVLEGELDAYQVSQKIGVGLRVVVAGKNGYAYTQAAEDAKSLVLRAMDNAKTVESEDEHPMQTKQDYVEVTPPACPLCDLSNEEKIDIARRMETLAKQMDARVFQTPHCVVSTTTFARHLQNTLGLDASMQAQNGAIMLQAAMKEGDEIHEGFAFRDSEDALDIDGCVAEAVKKAADQFGAASYTSGKTAVVLDRDAACDLLGAFSSMFCADMAQKGMSPLAKKLGEQIAADIVSIVDDPLYEKDPHAFDGEGTPSVKTSVVQQGVFQSFLHNLKTAKKDGVLSTSNAGRASAASPVSVSPCNFYILPGEKTQDELLEELGNGLLICEVSGLHAGLNAVTGDFSLLASGYVVKDGKRDRAVEQVTVAGNFLSLLMDIRAIGSDLYFGMSPVGTPSLLVENLTIAGSET